MGPKTTKVILNTTLRIKLHSAICFVVQSIPNPISVLISAPFDVERKLATTKQLD